MGAFGDFARELEGFSRRREILNEVRREIRRPVPALRRKVRAHALATLPSRGGLNKFVARATLSVRLRDRGRSAGLSIKVSRQSRNGETDLSGINERGRTRHPLYGSRRRWFDQAVAPGFFNKPWEESSADFVKSAELALDNATDKIRRG